MADLTTIRNKRRKRNRNDTGLLGNLARSGLGEGVALGFGDEIEAGVGAAYDKFFRGKDFTDSYGTRVKDVRGDIAKFKETNPGFAYGSEILGTVGTGAFAIPKLLAKGASKLGSKGVQKVAANQYVAPAVTSGIYGAGTGEDNASNRLTNAAILSVLSPVLQTGANIAIPKIASGGKYLLEKGIQPTASQLYGAGQTTFNKLIPKTTGLGEIMANSYPGAGIPITTFKIDGLLNYNYSLIDDALSAIGKTLPRDGIVKKAAESIDSATLNLPKILQTNLSKSAYAKGKPEGYTGDVGVAESEFGIEAALGTARDLINDSYSEVLLKANLGKDVVKNLYGETKNILNQGNLDYGLSSEVYKKVQARVMNILEGRAFNSVGKNGQIKLPKDISGQSIKEIQTQLNKLKSQKFLQQDPDSIQVIDDVLKNILSKLDDKTATQLSNANIANARIGPIERIFATNLGRDSKHGVITPGEYLKNAQKEASKKGIKLNDEFEAIKLSKIANQYIGGTFPDSGTASRLLLAGNAGELVKNIAKGVGFTLPVFSGAGQAALRTVPPIVSAGVKSPPVNREIVQRNLIEEENRRKNNNSKKDKITKILK
tara:strand:- start:977 stop:2776 length:1800 start_codon:yes stop_codon:yes gene_type:complete